MRLVSHTLGRLIVLMTLFGLHACGFVDSAGDNQAPMVQTSDITIEEGKSVTLRSQITDDFQRITSISWIQTAGTAVSLVGADTATPTFTAPNVNTSPVANSGSFEINEGDTVAINQLISVEDDDGANEVLVFTVTVTDNFGQTAEESVSVTVLSNAEELVVRFTAPVNGELLADGDGNVVEYRHDGSETTTDLFTYSASDGSFASNEATISLTVNPVNDAPLVPDLEFIIEEDQEIDGQFEATDAEGDELRYEMALAPERGRVTLDEETGEFEYEPDNNVNGDDAFSVRVVDSNGAEGTGAAAIKIVPENDRPEVKERIPDQSATEDQEFLFTFEVDTFEDPDGEPLSYSASGLPDEWLSFNAAERTFSGTPPRGNAGSSLIRVTATDQLGASVSDRFELNVVSINEPPSVGEPIEDQSVTTGQDFTLQFAPFVDPNDDELTYSAEGHPAWLQFDAATRVFSGTPVDGDAGPPSSITVTASDEFGGSASDTFTLTVVSANRPPVVDNPIPDQTVTLDQPFDFTFAGNTFSDPDGHLLRYEAVGQPAGVGFDSDSRTFSGAPTESGDFEVRVTAIDPDGETVADTFLLSVNRPPVAEGQMADRTITEGQPESFTFDAERFSDPDGDELTFTASGTPAGFGLEAGTRTFSGTATESGIFPIEVTATDPAGASASSSFTLTVDPADPAPDETSGETLQAQSAGYSQACWATPEGQAFVKTLPAAAAASATYALVEDGRKGVVTISDPATGEFSYQPTGTARGADSFTYAIEHVDGVVETHTARVIIDQKIMPLGDEITAGVIDSAGDLPVDARRTGYRLPLSDALEDGAYYAQFVGSFALGGDFVAFDPDVEAHAGWTADEIAHGNLTTGEGGVYAWLDANPADIVLLHIGSNALTEAEHGVAAILDEIDRWEAGANGNPVTVVLARIIDQAPANPTVSIFNDNIVRMAQDRIANPSHYAYPDRIVVVDQQSALDYTSDMFDTHMPNDSGYQKMAETWLDALTSGAPGMLEGCASPPLRFVIQ